MQNRRRGFSFRSALRMRMTRYMLFLALFSLLALGLSVLFLFLWSPIPRQLLFITDPHAQSSAMVFSNTVRGLFIFFFVLNILFLWLISVVAKNVLGPFVRINRVLEELASGNLPKDVRFRKNDETPFQQLVEPLNRALDHLRARRDELKSIIGELDSRLAECQSSGFSASSLEALQNLKSRVEQLT